MKNVFLYVVIVILYFSLAKLFNTKELGYKFPEHLINDIKWIINRLEYESNTRKEGTQIFQKHSREKEN